jgi:hypothetical protein
MKNEEIDERAFQQKKDYELQKLADEIIWMLEKCNGINDQNKYELKKPILTMYNRAKRIKKYETN